MNKIRCALCGTINIPIGESEVKSVSYKTNFNEAVFIIYKDFQYECIRCGLKYFAQRKVDV